MLEGLYIRIF